MSDTKEQKQTKFLPFQNLTCGKSIGTRKDLPWVQSQLFYSFGCDGELVTNISEPHVPYL